MTAASAPIPLLDFRAAHYETSYEGANVSLSLRLQVMSRELVVARFDHEPSLQLFASACCGLALPSRGEARFLDRNWAHVNERERGVLRGMIGQSFETGGWMETLSVAENVLLQQAYHTDRPDVELRREAAGLANHFGLPGLPTVAPSDLGAGDLQRAGLVRAFLDSPELVILQAPTRDAPQLLAPLLAAINRAQQRAAAVLWLTFDTNSPRQLLRMADQTVRVRQSGQLERMEPHV
jgi:phospholipid/cholesterol/gamma-HCH transport system ATP-binding protein